MLDLDLSLESIAALGVADPYGPNLISNGTFATDTTGWAASAATLSVVAGKLRVTNTGAGIGRGSQSVTVENGATYRWEAELTPGTSACTFRIGTTVGGSQLVLDASASGSRSGTFVATATSVSVSAAAQTGGAGNLADFDNIILKKVL